MRTGLTRRGFLHASTLLAASCTRGPRAPAAPAETGAQLVRRAIVIDGNLVPPLDDEAPLPADAVQAIRASGLTAAKVTVGGFDGSYPQTITDLEAYGRAIARAADVYLQIKTVADFATAKRTGKVGIILSFEAASMLEGQVARIAEFAALGVRVMQLSYNTASPFAAGVLVPQPSSGLTALGRQAVAELDARGVTLDLSHSDERSSLEAIAASRRPALITHAGCAAVHAHPRNKTDAVLRALADRGGTIGIYELSFISAGPAQQTLDDYLAHVVHALKRCGEDHVGIGSDALMTPWDTSPAGMAEWDKQTQARKAAGIGAPDEGRPPYVVGLNRPDRITVIADALLQRGYPPRVTEKLLGANFQRVFAQTWPA